jgi:hypothetical protein
MVHKRATLADRRRFLQHVLGAGAVSCLPRLSRATLVDRMTPAHTVTTNRAPLNESAFYPLPLGQIAPAGWLHAQLQIQADGLSGHLDETWPDVGPNSGWLGGTGESWERGPYYLDGLIPLAYLLQDSRLKAKAQRFIDWTLGSQGADGMFGPKSNQDWWPRMVMLKALTQYAEATADARVVPFMHRYFLFQLEQLPISPLRDWGRFRWQDNVMTVLWTYNRVGDPKLLELAKLLHSQGHDWVAEFESFPYKKKMGRDVIARGEGLKDLALSTHGVNNGQAVKAGPLWYLVSGNAADKDGAHRMMTELDEYHGLPNGMFSCDEHFAGRNPSQGSELCTVVEYMFSLEQALAITGDVALGDRLEKLAFNALLGTMTDDMWAHQYNQEPNQVECSMHTKPWTTDGPASNLFGLEPNFGCCTANFNQGLPKFASSLIMMSRDHGLAVTSYAPCEANLLVRGTPVRLVQETEYPFRGRVRLTIHQDRPANFPLDLRIPVWAEGTTLSLNGKPQPAPVAGSFARLQRTWAPGDAVEINFPMNPRVTEGFQDSVAIERGPIVFSYDIGEDWLKLRDRGMTADWQVYPTTPWNYAVRLSGAENHGIRVSEGDVGAMPFSRKATPISVEVTARKLPQWVAVDGVADPVPASPVQSTEPDETIRLIPYAAAKLRITSFPTLS